MAHYVKLFDSIIHSTIWQEDAHVKVVWITMLAMSDSRGEVQASIPGLAKAAGVSISQCEESLAKFLAPDPYSRSTEADGRRIEVVPGGWELINYEKYRKLKSEEQEKEKTADRQRRFRERHKPVTDSNATSRPVTPNNPIVEEEVEVEIQKEKDCPATSPSALLPEPPSSGKPKKEKKEKKPKVITTALRPEALEAFQAVWEAFPRRGPQKWDREAQSYVSEPQSPGSRLKAETNFQRIIDNGVASARLLYLAFYAYVTEEPKVEKGFVQQVSTFFGPEKATYLEWLDRARQIERENYQEAQ